MTGWQFWIDQVGPEPAGAVPGPACYRHGGRLTVTDANVMLGRSPTTSPASSDPAGTGLSTPERYAPVSRAVTLDFTGTSPQLATNLNAPAAVTTAACPTCSGPSSTTRSR